jgi:hypothetical protein
VVVWGTHHLDTFYIGITVIYDGCALGMGAHTVIKEHHNSLFDFYVPFLELDRKFKDI